MEKEAANPAKGDEAQDDAKDESEPQEKPAKTDEKRKKLNLLDKFFILMLAVAILYIGYLYFQEEIIKVLQMNPPVWAFFKHITEEISQRTLLGLFYASAFGSLFFVFLPIEVIFLYYISLEYSVPLVIALAAIGSFIGLFIDYLFGFILGARILKFFLRAKFEKFHQMTQKWGGIVVLFGSIIPFPIQPISVVIGAAKYPFYKFAILIIIGIFAKLFALVFMRTYLLSFFS